MRVNNNQKLHVCCLNCTQTAHFGQLWDRNKVLLTLWNGQSISKESVALNISLTTRGPYHSSSTVVSCWESKKTVVVAVFFLPTRDNINHSGLWSSCIQSTKIIINIYIFYDKITLFHKSKDFTIKSYKLLVEEWLKQAVWLPVCNPLPACVSCCLFATFSFLSNLNKGYWSNKNL